MDSLWLQIGLLAVIIVLNGAFAGSEIALITLREGQLDRLAKHSRTGRTLARLARDPNRFLATIQIGITMAGLLAGATAAVTLGEALAPTLEPLVGAASEPVAIIIISLILTFFTLVFGELAPKRVALQRAEGWGLLAARPLSSLSAVTRPLVWLLGRSTDVVVRLTGADPDMHREDLDEDELRHLLTTHRAVSPEQRAILLGTFVSAELAVRDVLLPRVAVQALAHDTPVDVAARRLLETGHSRAPVYHEVLDDADGIVHVRDLIQATGVVGDHTSRALILPETVPLLEALRQLQGVRQHMAIVINEHGVVEGIVTLEDLLEELVGEIYDEFDQHTVDVERHPDGSITVPGTFPVHDLPGLEIDIPDGSYTTIAGFILEKLGRLPVPDDVVAADGVEMRVVGVSRRTVASVRITRLEEVEADVQFED